ncbi:MAG TPA: metal-dependent transcriptional regulator [Candidatus Dormibacteraeota bacterium]|jgi:DtxR family Mn-dependent transcriptional regulator
MRRSSLTQSQEDYLKALYQLRTADRPVTTSELAERLGVSAASTTEMLGKLTALRLVDHDRYRGSTLTPAGEAVALEMIRHHRLLEIFLTRALGYRWDEVHEEAERLEHHISERLEARIFDSLGRPDVDPHGDPIPTLEGEMPSDRHRTLDQCRRGELLEVRRVSDRDPDKLRALDLLGFHLDEEVEVVKESLYEGPVVVKVGGHRRQVPLGLARAVYVA